MSWIELHFGLNFLKIKKNPNLSVLYLTRFNYARHWFQWCPLKHEQPMTKECWVSEWWWLTVNVQWVGEWQRYNGHRPLPLQGGGLLRQSWTKVFFVPALQNFRLCKFVQPNIVHQQTSKTRSATQPKKTAPITFLRLSLQEEEGGSRRRCLARGVPTPLVHTGYHHLCVHSPRITKLPHKCSTSWFYHRYRWKTIINLVASESVFLVFYDNNRYSFRGHWIGDKPGLISFGKN